MTNRERFRAILGRKAYDRVPCVNFGFWPELLDKWAAQGHIEKSMKGKEGNSYEDEKISKRLGFDYNLFVRLMTDIPERGTANGACNLTPEFEPKLIRKISDDEEECLSYYGSIEVHKNDIVSSIHTETGYLLRDRGSWETVFKPRLIFSSDNISREHIERVRRLAQDDYPVGIRAGSMIGQIRNMLGLENLCYMQYDDPELLGEIIHTVGECVYRTVEYMLNTGIDWDYGLLWEDICYNKGPLVSPGFFRAEIGPLCQRVSGLAKSHGVDILMVDCDGDIERLLPVWVENGVNTMFPIEVGTWGGSFEYMSERYGANVRGIGGMNKELFTTDRAQIDKELERLRRIVDLGGYLPCPDHALVPDSQWELVQYYTEKFRYIFG